MGNGQERLQKVIAQSGLTSRRKAEQLILAGKVKVNNKVVTTLGVKVSPEDEITVNNIAIEKEESVYYLFNKPREVISSLADDKGRAVITDYLSDIETRVFSIGRLEYQTSGLLLLTNDGEFANLLMHPRYGVEKVYVAKVRGVATKQDLQRMIKGVKDKGEVLKAVRYKILSVDPKKKSSIIQITLREGKYRHIRRMMEQLGYPVIRLTRERYGMLTLNGVPSGQYRPLTPHEVKQLRNLALKNVKKNS